MLRRDYMLNEANKLAKLLAKLMGLKAEGSNEEYRQYFNSILTDEYDTELEELLKATETDFANTIKNAGYSAEKLNSLSQLLYVFAGPFEVTEETASLLKKVLILFDELEAQHHYESFENLSKKNIIYSFFKNNYERS